MQLLKADGYSLGQAGLLKAAVWWCNMNQEYKSIQKFRNSGRLACRTQKPKFRNNSRL